MKKNLCILCSFILILTLTACGTGFDGSRTGNDSELVMDFKILNTTDSQALAAAEGDTIPVSYTHLRHFPPADPFLQSL